MVDFYKHITISPNFRIIPLDHEQIVVAGERDTYILNGTIYNSLFRSLKTPTSLQDIIMQTATMNTQHESLFLITQLMDMKILEVLSPEENGVEKQSNSKSGDSVIRYSIEHVEVMMLGAMIERWVIDRIIAGMHIDSYLTLVVVDDAMDTRLNGIGVQFRNERRTWMLLKPGRLMPLVGPLFLGDHENTPCQECLGAQLLYNQPVRNWLLKKGVRKDWPLPVFRNSAYNEKMIGAIVDAGRQLLVENDGRKLYTVAPDGVSLTSHLVRKRPQCPSCGDPNAYRRTVTQPIIVKQCLKIGNPDGGSRSVSPQLTVERLQALVSDVTGIISDLRSIPVPRCDGLSIFKSTFYKTPVTKKTVDYGDFIQVSLGKGITDEQSKAGAICESVERYACQYQGDEYIRFMKISEWRGTAIAPDKLVHYSARQYERFQSAGHQIFEELQVSQKFSEALPIHWTCAWSLTKKKKCLVPFTYCYANTPPHWDDVIRFNSNGCAGGNTIEEAIIQGLYELVERDATAIWWYNKISRPEIDCDELDSGAMKRIRTFLDDAWDFWLLDLTHDLFIPVVAAIAKNRCTGEFRMGFGCHLDPYIASLRSLTELCQIIAIGDAGCKRFDFKQVRVEPFLLPDGRSRKRSLREYGYRATVDIAEDIAYCVQLLRERGFQCIVHDYTRPDIPLYTVRTIIPGLCHIWPQFGNRRLYTVPLVLGWQNQQLQEEFLNPIALLL